MRKASILFGLVFVLVSAVATAENRSTGCLTDGTSVSYPPNAQKRLHPKNPENAHLEAVTRS